MYATANIYESLSRYEDVNDPDNIVACNPTWDIDNAVERWKDTLTIIKEITSFLKNWGIKRSLFIKWSGRGAHIHHSAISMNVREKVNPLDASCAIVEYVNLKLQKRFTEILSETKSTAPRVDNEMDKQRLFTCPLSLHRELDRVCICFKDAQLEDFKLEWTEPESYRHNHQWREHVEGEADELALKAYETVGSPIKYGLPRSRVHPPLDVQINRWLKYF